MSNAGTPALAPTLLPLQIALRTVHTPHVLVDVPISVIDDRHLSDKCVY